MLNYKETKDVVSGSIVIERTNEDGSISFIPAVEGNSDYQAYLRWLENPGAEENQGGLI